MDINIEDNVATFRGNLRMEGSFGSYEIGEFDNTMSFEEINQDRGCIIWDYEPVELNDEADSGEEVIGLWFDNGKLVDYDGVMDLPVQAVALLQHLGYDCQDFLEEDDDED